MAALLAQRLLLCRQANPEAKILVLAFSGGAGIALFACEKLQGRSLIETMVLACPAVSPQYNLAPALSAVQRCYALISRRDRVILGLGTRVFGTTDRQFTAAAGHVGFRRPANLPRREAKLYSRVREINWTPELKELGHHGGHTAWLSHRFLDKHLLPMLHGEPLLPTTEVPRV